MFVILEISSVILAVESAFFLSKGNLGLSANEIAALSRAKYGANLSVLKSLADQNSDNWIGMVLLLTSVIVQIVMIAFPSQLNNSPINLSGLALSLVICGIIFVVCLKLSSLRASRLYQQAKEIITASRTNQNQ